MYAAYESKAGLATALVDSVDISAGAEQMMAALAEAVGDPSAQLAALAAFDRRLFENDGDLIMLMREAGRSVPELAAGYREGRARGVRVRKRVFSAWPAHAFRDGMSAALAVDSSMAICNIDVFRVLTGERGWGAEQVERWWHESLVRLLLA